MEKTRSNPTPLPTLRVFARSPAAMGLAVLVVLGAAVFVAGAAGGHPERVWQAYLINFLLWSGMAAGGLLFSAVMHVTRARWSGPMAGIAESFAAFFPVSFGLFLVLFGGGAHVFPWMLEDLHGKEIWLNRPFLFARDAIGLLILYGVGTAYLLQSLRLRFGSRPADGRLRGRLYRHWSRVPADAEVLRRRMTVLGGVYCLSFAVVLSLLGYDLVMALDPHWVSTLFGAYSFVKAFYVGLGALVILSGVLYLRRGEATGLKPAHFHDLGKLLLAFCLVWGDFFYAQFVVIWYGNIPEETAYVIERTLTAPWNVAAWIVLGGCFVAPFLILLNRRVKTVPAAMIGLCTMVILGMWLEHLLLVGPVLSRHAERLPLGFSELLVTLGFFAMMAGSVWGYLNLFPEVAGSGTRDVG